MLSLQQIRVLLAIREHGSLTRAAEALHYGVPTVAHHLDALEAHLGLRVVERRRAGTVLTPLGVEYAEEVERAVVHLDRAERMVADRRESGVSILRVGTFASVGSRLLPAAIARMQQRHSVRVEAVEAEPTEVVRMLRSGEVHAGLIYDFSDEPAFISPDLRLEPLLSEPYRVMVGRSSPWAEHAVLDFAELAQVPWVCSRSNDEAPDRVLRRTCRAVGHEVRELMRTDDLYMIHGLVAEGLGLALATAAAVDADFDVALRPAVQDLGERRVSFVTRSEHPPAATAWLGAELKRVAARREHPAGRTA
ncbi:LysR family transcriptional regulator [Leucobacter iarius]|uniref:HTH lysR-type domain-containing protein n=1 Tax=Leucobacter iarius TaxID=333963 RepID=A0ABN2LFE9_9MICO